jgi:uncharacterized peroxidase-related enzyme
MNGAVKNSLPRVEETEATGVVGRIYAEIKREWQTPFVPNAFKALAVSPAALTISWEMFSSFYRNTTFPQSLFSMILYTIAKSGNCTYCSANHELTCRTLGIDEETLDALVKDLGNVSPERIRVIIEFALKAAHDPKSLVGEDYQRVRDVGVTDAEMVELILIAGFGVFGDTMADALKIEVEPETTRALGR